MKITTMYRRRLIPNECVLLKDDTILSFDGHRLVTSWNALKPKKELHHGISCFFFDDNIKLSKFYRADNSLIYWYTDIISADITQSSPVLSLPYSVGNASSFTDTSQDFFAKEDDTSLVVTDLLADILIYPDGFVKVVDLGEISDAIDKNLIDGKTAAMTLRITDRTLEDIYSGRFIKYQHYLESFEDQ